MGNTNSLPDYLTEQEAREVAGELWQQYIFDGLKNENNQVSKEDLVDSASEALMACQGESHQMRWAPKKNKATTTKWVFSTNMEYGKALFKKLASSNRSPQSDLCKFAHQGLCDDFVAAAEMVDDDELMKKDPRTSVSPIMYAVMFNFRDITEYLTSRISVNGVKDKDGKSLLHLASVAGNVEICESLIEAGADVNVLDDDGRFAADWAMSNYHLEGYVKKTPSVIKALTKVLAPTNGEEVYSGPRGPNKEPPSKYDSVVAVQMSNCVSKIMMNESGNTGNSSRSRLSNRSTKSSNKTSTVC